MATAVIRTDLRTYLPLLAEGKVREVYELGSETLLFVATDRISAYDVVMSTGIPQKGRLLTKISEAWFAILQSGIAQLRTHFISTDLPQALVERLPSELCQQLRGRSMQVRRLKVFPIEAIVRGYITGSAWSEYRKRGTVNDMRISQSDGAAMEESQKFERPLYTPSTKAEQGQHDENIHPDKAAEIVGPNYAKRIEQLSLELYSVAADYALARGIIVADTKFEFGLDVASDEVVLVDEVLTPDSSRFWLAENYRVGEAQESLDKQYMRDWLVETGQKGHEGVQLPDHIAKNTAARYVEAYEMLVGRTWSNE